MQEIELRAACIVPHDETFFQLHIFQLHISVACPVNDWLVADVA